MSEQTLRTLLDRQERERQLVAYEIHDGLAQYLSAAIMHLETYEAGLPEGVGSNIHISEVLRLLRTATAEARHLIAGLRPPALDELGLDADSQDPKFPVAMYKRDDSGRLTGCGSARSWTSTPPAALRSASSTP